MWIHAKTKIGFIALTLVFYSASLNAAPISPSAVEESAPLNAVARILWLDKQTNARQIVTLQIGIPQTLGTLLVKLDRCIPDLNNQPNTDAAWLQITESGRGNDWFKGWMVNTLPEIAALEHPRYDVQVLGCGTKARTRRGPVAKSGAVIETGNDSESSTPASDDPFAVPGVADTSSAPSPATPSEPTAVGAEPQPAPPIMPDNSEPASAPEPITESQQLERMMDEGVY